MKKLINLAQTFRDSEKGAAMIEYSILIGLIAAAVIATIAAIAVWITSRWGALQTALGA
ncbi:Flp family type IVb pilin [Nitratireductor sp. ZSWI3]|uniref:Flp family type IVb pilin n=1 Tax=Nitratireductor sp. ZSWI3 TaxID=2966359 RepID=UPI0021503BFA|nr:Flp family type IVb pilin [Nitratireductor sp. ZSWI3]MCR4264848.1 Flp family type IVb pilin [Nitratireductor sp. ZSWI3]